MLKLKQRVIIVYLDKISKDISIIEDELNAKVLKKTKN